MRTAPLLAITVTTAALFCVAGCGSTAARPSGADAAAASAAPAAPTSTTASATATTTAPTAPVVAKTAAVKPAAAPAAAEKPAAPAKQTKPEKPAEPRTAKAAEPRPATPAEPTAAKAPEPKPAKPAEPKAPAWDLFVAMEKELAWSDANTKAAFISARSAREKALDAWPASPEGRRAEALKGEIAAAKAAKEETRLGLLQAEAKKLADQYGELRRSTRASVFATVPEAQTGAVASLALYGNLDLRYAKARLALTDEQRTALRKVTDGLGAKVSREQLLKDPYLTGDPAYVAAVNEQADTVLTPEQRARIAPKAKAAAPAAPKN